MFFDKRKRFNGNVAVLLRDFSIDVNDPPLGVLAVLDHAWLQKFNVHEATLLVAYSHASALYKQAGPSAEQFVFSKLYPTQLEWLSGNKVRAVVVEPMTKLLKEHAYRSYDAFAATPGVSRKETARPERQGRPGTQSTARGLASSPMEKPKPWLFNHTSGQLTRRDCGRVFEKSGYYRDGTGYVVRDKEFSWAPDSDIEFIGNKT